MRITCKVDAPVPFIYDKMINSAIHDIKEQTGEILDRTKLKGFQYNKTFSGKQKASIIIVDEIENELYKFQTSTKIREFLTSYHLVALTDTSCKIICEESQISHGIMLKMNDFFMGVLVGFQKKKQIKLMMEAMEKEYNSSLSFFL